MRRILSHKYWEVSRGIFLIYLISILSIVAQSRGHPEILELRLCEVEAKSRRGGSGGGMGYKWPKCWLSPSHWMHRPAESESGAVFERWVPSSMRVAAFIRTLRFSSFLTDFSFSLSHSKETNIRKNATLKCKPNCDHSDECAANPWNSNRWQVHTSGHQWSPQECRCVGSR